MECLISLLGVFDEGAGRAGVGHRGDVALVAQSPGVVSSSKEDEPRPARAIPIANRHGSAVSVASVEATRPPMTARPSGALCSPPSPSASAIGAMPAIIARLVIRIARRGARADDGGVAGGVALLTEPLRERH